MMKSSTTSNGTSGSNGSPSAPARDIPRVRRSPWVWLHHFMNRVRLAKSYYRGDTHVSGFPAHLKIELTNYCNLACTFCPHEQMERSVGFMKTDLFKRIVDSSVHHVEFVYLHFMGESLVHPKIFDMIRYARSKGIRAGLSTNASFLDEKRARGLLTSNIDFLIISFEGANPDTYEEVRLKGSYKETLQNIQSFYRLKREIPNGVASAVQMIHTSESDEEVEGFRGQWPEGVIIKKIKNWGGQMPELTASKSVQNHLSPCALPWKELSVLWDGTLTLCANTYDREVVLGHLDEESLEEVWNGPKMQEIRRRHVARQVKGIPVCETCPRYSFAPGQFLMRDQLALRKLHYLGNGGNMKTALS